MTQAAVLEGLLAAASAPAGERGVIIFDLDDTLLSTTGRHQRILREFAADRSVRARFPEAAALGRVAREHMRYSIVDTARAAGVQDAELLEFLRAYWFARFFKNEYLEEDEPVPGAPEFCAEALSRGATLVYLTGRDEGMRVGTLAALSRHGFPAPDGRSVVLTLKPRFDTPDFEFKAEALKAVERLGSVAGGFENEPAHVNLMAEAFPGASMVLVETRHSGKAVAPHPAVSRIKDFRRR